MKTVLVVVCYDFSASIVHMEFVFKSVSRCIRNKLAQFWYNWRVDWNVKCWFAQLPHIPHVDSQKTTRDNLEFIVSEAKIRHNFEIFSKGYSLHLLS